MQLRSASESKDAIQERTRTALAGYVRRRTSAGVPPAAPPQLHGLERPRSSRRVCCGNYTYTVPTDFVQKNRQRPWATAWKTPLLERGHSCPCQRQRSNVARTLCRAGLPNPLKCHTISPVGEFECPSEERREPPRPALIILSYARKIPPPAARSPTRPTQHDYPTKIRSR